MNDFTVVFVNEENEEDFVELWASEYVVDFHMLMEAFAQEGVDSMGIRPDQETGVVRLYCFKADEYRARPAVEEYDQALREAIVEEEMGER